MSRDPLGEKGGNNLYGMIGNDPLNRTDLLGMVESSAASQGAMILLAKTLQASGYGTSEIVIALTHLIASRVDWAGEEILRQLFNGGGSHFTRFDDPAWSNYMMTSRGMAKVDFWEGDYCSSKCADLAVELANLKNLINNHEHLIESFGFDVNQYNGDRARGQVAFNTAALSAKMAEYARKTKEYYAEYCAAKKK